MRSLSRLKALQAFEAAARHGSFTGAGRELNVTPAAVGQMVRSLEDWLGAPLFRRRGFGRDRLVPMADTRDALMKLGSGFDALEEALGQLKRRGTDAIVTVTASQAIVAKWLLPHLESFAARRPDIVVRLDVTDRIVDMASGEADLGVRCGPGQWKGLEAAHLRDESMIVVCAPGLLPCDGQVDIAWLRRQTLLHDTTAIAVDALPGWQAWGNMAGAPLLATGREVRINAASAIIQAAIIGQGVALVRRSLVSDDIAAGRLAHIFADREMPISWAYYAVSTREALARPAVVAFRDWLVETWRA